MSTEIRVERRAGWRKLVFNRPDKLNAVNEAMLHSLTAALNEAEAEHDCRAVPLRQAAHLPVKNFPKVIRTRRSRVISGQRGGLLLVSTSSRVGQPRT